MSLSFNDGPTATITTTYDSVSIRKSDGLVTVAGKFTFPLGGISSISASTVLDPDHYGSYVDCIVSCNMYVVRLRFYDAPLIDFKCLSGSTSGTLTLTFLSEQTKWFTTLYRYGVEANDNTTREYGDWSTVFRSNVNPMDLSQWTSAPNGIVNTSGFYGQPYVSEQQGGIGHYVDASLSGNTWPAVMESSWTYSTSAPALTVVSGQSQPGFCITTVGGYQGLLEYSKWQCRNIGIRPSTHLAKRTPMGTAADLNNSIGLGYNSQSAILSDISNYASKLPTDYIDFDWGAGRHVDHQGTWNILSQYSGVLPGITSRGYKPGMWLSSRVEAAVIGSNITNSLGNTPIPLAAITSASYTGGMSGSSERMWDHTSPEGVACIRAMARKVHEYGAKYCRWDIQRNEMWREFGVLKVFSDAIRALDPDFVIEAHMPYLQSLSDSIRTNDKCGYSGSWTIAHRWRYKVAACSCPNVIIDTDQFTDDFGTDVTDQRKSLRYMYSVGRPIWACWMRNTFPITDPTIAGYVAAYDALPACVPSREITDGWDSPVDATHPSIRSTYSDGSTVTYDAAADTLSFVSGTVTFPVIGIADALPASVNFPVIGIADDSGSVTFPVIGIAEEDVIVEFVSFPVIGIADSGDDTTPHEVRPKLSFLKTTPGVKWSSTDHFDRQGIWRDIGG